MADVLRDEPMAPARAAPLVVDDGELTAKKTPGPAHQQGNQDRVHQGVRQEERMAALV
jgi:hypothetical protein